MADTNGLYANLVAGTPSVLLIDDDPNILDTGKDILEDSGYVVSIAANGKEAINQLAQKEFNIVIADFQLPDSTGLELARKVREQNDHTCVILMTGHASLEMAVKAIQEAVYDYLIKPVDPAQLKRTIERAVEKQKLTLENKQLVSDLKKSNEAMARLDSLKTKLITVMSHDLRTPLSSIRGYSELLRSGVKGRLTDVQKRMTEITIQEADHLNGLIGDMLDLASVESGRLSLDMRPVPFEDLLNKGIARVKIFSEMKEIPVEVSLLSTLPAVQADAPRMTQVIANVLRGALKLAQRGGKVAVEAGVKDGEVNLRIVTAGQGYTQDQIDSFFSTNTFGEPTGNQDGLRIALAIAREIVQAHGGSIGMESPGADQGSMFWIRIPVIKE